ncbi:hypothetical protein LSCM1_00149 [Leishmania martiniquensis]|uniref:Uncharacterized protein n=1 Tax=Leishmania martiniquensis TaxID=1580590 RepID=A0A836KFT3_9TRYP|nr:hypothetical protein LSCM1_00149 [Leishmania martiniquensis]
MSSTSLIPPTMFASPPLSNLSASVQPPFYVDKDLKREVNDRNGGQLKNGGDGAPVSNSAGPARTHSLIGMRGSVFPEKKGGLPKMGHAGVCYHQEMYIFGGVNSKGQYSNHIFCHEKRTLLWREIRGVGVVPRGRANHAATLIGSKMYIHGGHRQLEVFDDLFAYDIETVRWEKMSRERSQGPGPVFLHSMIHIPPLDSLLVLGGIHQREQNIYLGHLFDVRNRVWTGVPPPHSVNAQHLQLVTAAYFAPSETVVVLGLMEADVMEDDTSPTPHVHLFHPSTFVWRRVDTTTAPQSPLPFRIENTWESLLHLLIPSGGGLYDPLLQSWMFPLPSTVTDISSDEDTMTPSSSSAGVELPPVPLNKYGFLVLDLTSMSWSLVPCSLPRKLMAELNAVNRTVRERMERLALRNSAVVPAAAVSESASQRKSLGHPSPTSGGVLPMNSISSVQSLRDFSSRHSSLLPHQSLPWARKSSTFSSMPWPRSAVTRSSTAPGNNDANTAVHLGASLYRRLFSFDNAPEFMRKYTLVAVRDEPAKSGKLRPLQYVVLHGGLTEPTDYAMFMFVPMLTRLGYNAPLPTTSTGPRPRSDSLRGRCTANAGARRSLSSFGDHGATDDDYGGDDFDDDSSSVICGASSTAYSAQRHCRSRASPAQQKELKGLVNSRSGRDSDDDDDAERRLTGGGEERKSYLLPTLPSGRTNSNYHRFALQFAPGNSMQKESLLPYTSIPVAVFRTPKDVQKWSQSYYADQRRWLSERLKDAMLEERNRRRLRQLSRARQLQKTTVSGAQGMPSLLGTTARDEDSNDESESLMGSFYLSEPFAGNSRPYNTAKSAVWITYEEQLKLDAAAAAVTQAEAPKRRLRDFFEEHGLDVLDDSDLQKQQSQQQTTLSTAAKTKGSSDTKQEWRSKDSKPKEKAGVMEDAKAKVAKRSVSLPSTSAVAPDVFMPFLSEAQITRVGFERLRMKGRRDGGRERMPAAIFHDSSIHKLAGGIAETGLDFRNLAPHALLRRSLARLGGDGDPYEISRRRAQLRWRFLRSLVRTGDGAYLLYLASQAESKMKGIPVSGIAGLLLAPELHFVGSSQAYQVPRTPVPYSVGAAAVPSPTSASRFAQMTVSGMVVYHSLK